MDKIVDLLGAFAAVLVPVSTSLAAWFAWKSKQHSSDVNDAVNHTDGKHPRLFDLALQSHTMATRNEIEVEKLGEAMTDLGDEMKRHVEWEENVKWEALGDDLRGLQERNPE